MSADLPPELVSPDQLARPVILGHRLMRLFGWLLFGVLLGASIYLFYLHGYRSLIANNSYSSTVELVRRKMLVSRGAQTLVLGNSTAAEGFPASAYNRLAGSSTPAINLGVPAGHMFLYEKILDMAIEHGLRPRAVALYVTPEILTFSASPYYDYLKNDLTVLKVELEWDDLPRLRAHSRSLLSYIDYAAPLVVRPALFSADLRDFASRPGQRIKDSLFVSQWLDSMTAPESFPEPDHSFSVCQAGPLDTLRQRIDQERQNAASPVLADLERVLNGYEGRAVSGPHLKVDTFERDRFRALLKRMSAKVPHVFLVPVPYYDPEFTQFPADFRAVSETQLQSVGSTVPGVHVVPRFPVDCTMMMDTVHLNRKGGEALAAFLRERIEATLSGFAATN